MAASSPVVVEPGLWDPAPARLPCSRSSPRGVSTDAWACVRCATDEICNDCGRMKTPPALTGVMSVISQGRGSMGKKSTCFCPSEQLRDGGLRLAPWPLLVTPLSLSPSARLSWTLMTKTKTQSAVLHHLMEWILGDPAAMPSIPLQVLAGSEVPPAPIWGNCSSLLLHLADTHGALTPCPVWMLTLLCAQQ